MDEEGLRYGREGRKYGQEMGARTRERKRYEQERGRGMDGREEEACGKRIMTPGTLAWTETQVWTNGTLHTDVSKVMMALRR